MKENTVKENIMNRLYKRIGICAFCGKPQCAHDGNQHLPDVLNLDDVLRAINLDNHFGED